MNHFDPELIRCIMLRPPVTFVNRSSADQNRCGFASDSFAADGGYSLHLGQIGVQPSQLIVSDKIKLQHVPPIEFDCSGPDFLLRLRHCGKRCPARTLWQREGAHIQKVMKIDPEAAVELERLH